MSWIDDLINELPDNGTPLDWSLESELYHLHRTSYFKDQVLSVPDTQEEGLKLLKTLKMNQICRVKEMGSYGQNDYVRYVRSKMGEFY